MKDFKTKVAAPRRGEGKSYFKPEKGTNRLRVLDMAAAWETWVRAADQSTPHRREEKFTKEELDALGVVPEPKSPMQKDIYIAHVWDYKDDCDKTWNITQAGLMRELYNLIMDEDWGDLSSFDLTIDKSGEKLETSYIMNPKPKKKFEHTDKLRLWDVNKMFEGGDPFDSE